MELELMVCGECGCAFGLNQMHLRGLKDSHKLFYCPNGHQRHFVGETDREKLERLQSRQTGQLALIGKTYAANRRLKVQVQKLKANTPKKSK